MLPQSRLFDLLQCYGHIRTAIFTLLSPGDIIAACQAVAFVLSDKEKMLYTNPLLDIFYDLDWTKGRDDLNLSDCSVALVGDDVYNIYKPTSCTKNICMVTVRHCIGKCLVPHCIKRLDCGRTRSNVRTEQGGGWFNKEFFSMDNKTNVCIQSILHCNYENTVTHVGTISEVIPLVCSEAETFSRVPSINEVGFYNGIHANSRRLFCIPTYLSTTNKYTTTKTRLTVVLKDVMGFEFLNRLIYVVSIDPYSPLALALLNKPLDGKSIHNSEIDFD